ncbi:MAG: hypothetical protein KDC18_09110 [Alphaproteobacteria bacterium]|nr:hypothetical protein [Alphaproteobacteria bacterium]MCB9930768.1 hypothetical protein [Alphaproteobacteria bacterium]
MADQANQGGAAKRTVTLIGPAQSGKTHMVAALLINQPVQDLTQGPDALENPRLVRSDATTSDEEEEVWQRLSRHYNTMFFGRDLLELEATYQVHRYRLTVLWNGAAKQGSGLGLRRWLGGGKEAMSAVALELIDGRGGDLAYDAFVQATTDREAAQRRDDYRKALAASQGVMICQGLGDNDYQQMNIDALNRNIESILLTVDSQRKPKLRQVAICLTKYETLFSKYGADAMQKAVDRDFLIRRIREMGMDQMFRTILAHGVGEAAGRRGSGVVVRVFPVSTYGFVGGYGAANFYPWPQAPGLLTRAVEATDYDDPELEGLRDHYPVPISQGQAMQNWRPFNLAPPLLFAATGKVTGPLSVRAEDLV